MALNSQNLSDFFGENIDFFYRRDSQRHTQRFTKFFLKVDFLVSQSREVAKFILLADFADQGDLKYFFIKSSFADLLKSF